VAFGVPYINRSVFTDQPDLGIAGVMGSSGFDFWNNSVRTGGPTTGIFTFNDRLRPPQVFSVAVNSDATALEFLVGDNQIPFGRNIAALYRAYFTPVALVTAANIADPATQAAAFKSAVLVGGTTAPSRGGTTTFSDSTFYGQDGWFWGVSVSYTALESRPTAPFRAPTVHDIVSLNFPPEVSSPALSKTTNTVNGVTVSTVRASAVVPSNSQGVVAVFVTAGGTGYTSAPTVAFTGGLTSSGVAATATATIDGNGAVNQIFLATTGSGYGAAPNVVFSGGGGSGAIAKAIIGPSTAFDGFQLYLFNYLGGGHVEGPYVTASNLTPGQTASGTFNLIPDPAHITTFSFVAVSSSGRRQTGSSPTATLTV
jgi:hypothetical protein